MKTEEENAFPPTSSGPQKKKKGNITIIGGNLLVFIVYSLLCRINKNDGIVIDLFLIIAHVCICFIMVAIDSIRTKNKKWIGWLLSAGLVLVIGFSTCVIGWV